MWLFLMMPLGNALIMSEHLYRKKLVQKGLVKDKIVEIFINLLIKIDKKITNIIWFKR